MTHEVLRYASLSCGGSALGVCTSSGRVYLYGSLCDGKNTPTEVYQNMEVQGRCTRIFNSSLYIALLDEHDELYFAPHWLGGNVTHIPREIFGGCAISSIAFGACHVLLLASDNTLFVSGHKKDPAMGAGDTVNGGAFENVHNHNHPDYMRYELRKISQHGTRGWGTIRGIVCGQGIGGFWTQDEYSHYASTIPYEDNTNRRRYKLWPNASKPTQVAHLDLKGMCLGVSIGMWHAAVVDAEGSCVLWGRNEHGQLATNGRIYRHRPCAVDPAVMDGEGVQSIKTSRQHTTFLSTKGNVWVVGRVGNAQNYTPQLLPQTMFGNAAVREIYASMHYIAAVNDDGLVYTWGARLSETDGVLRLPALCPGFTVQVKGIRGVQGQNDVNATIKTGLDGATGLYCVRVYNTFVHVKAENLRIPGPLALPMQISCVWFDGELVGHWIRRLAFAMAPHARLGAQSQARVLLPDILPKIIA